MRVYVAMTVPVLSRFQAEGSYGSGRFDAYAVTPALREWYAESDTEELEHAAFMAAERATLPLLSADPSAPPVRVVVAADVSDADAVPSALAESSGVESHALVVVSGDLTPAAVASVHVDDAEAAADVTAAVAAMADLAAGDEDAQFVVDGAEGNELLWYDVTELEELVADLQGRYGVAGSGERTDGEGRA